MSHDGSEAPSIPSDSSSSSTSSFKTAITTTTPAVDDASNDDEQEETRSLTISIGCANGTNMSIETDGREEKKSPIEHTDDINRSIEADEQEETRSPIMPIGCADDINDSLETTALDEELESSQQYESANISANDDGVSLLAANATGMVDTMTPAVTELEESDGDDLRHNLVRWVFILLGIGVLLPWNSFVSTGSYFEMRLCHDYPGDPSGDDDDAGITWEKESSNFTLWFGIVYNGIGVITLGIMLMEQKRQRRRRKRIVAKVSIREDDDENDENDENDIRASEEGIHDACSLFTNPMPSSDDAMEIDSILFSGDRPPQDNNSSPNNEEHQPNTDTPRQRKRPHESTIVNLRKSQRQRILTPLAIYLIVFFLITASIPLPPTLLIYEDRDHARTLFLAFTIAGVGACGAAGAVASTGIVSFANVFPETIGIYRFQLGQAVGGAVVSILNFGSAWWWGGRGDSGNRASFWEKNCESFDGIGFDDDVDAVGYEEDGSRRGEDYLNLPNFFTLHPAFVQGIGEIESDASPPFIKQEYDTHLLPLTTEPNSTVCPEYHVDWGAFLYFAVGCALLLGCMCLFDFLDRLPITKFYRSLSNKDNTSKRRDGASQCNKNDLKKEYNEDFDNSSLAYSNWLGRHFSTDNHEYDINNGGYSDEEDDNEWDGPLQGIRNAIFFRDESIMWSAGLFATGSSISSADHAEETAMNVTAPESNTNLIEPLLNATSEPLSPTPEGNTKHDNNNHNIKNITSFVWRRIRWPVISLFLTFFITLTIFPSYIATLRSSKQCIHYGDRWSNDLFSQRLIVFFNLGDLVGRMFCFVIAPASDDEVNRIGDISDSSDCSGRTKTHSFCKKLALASLARAIFLPLFWFCATTSSSSNLGYRWGVLESIVTVLSYADIYPQLLLVAFAFTNGLFTALSFVCVPRLIPSTDEFQKVASTILNFTIGLGLFCGSLFSFIYVRWGSTIING